MRIQTEYISFKNHWTISCSHDFQAHQQRSQRTCLSQTALQWFKVLLGLWSALSGMSLALPAANRLCHRRSQVLPGLWSALPDLSPALLGAPRCTWRPLHQSSKLWDLTTLGFWSDNSQTLPEAPSDKNTFCWCGRRFCQTFAQFMSGRQPTTPETANTYYCGAATSAWIVKSDESWLDQERLYHTWGPMLSHPWRRKHCISVWVCGYVQRWIQLYGPDPMTGVNL